MAYSGQEMNQFPGSRVSYFGDYPSKQSPRWLWYVDNENDNIPDEDVFFYYSLGWK